MSTPAKKVVKLTQKRSSHESADLPLDVIQPNRFQPRDTSRLDPIEMAELADSIRAIGVIQPIVVRPLGSGRYELVAGERRWRAAQMAGLDEIPSTIRHLDDLNAAAFALIENIQRKNLNPIEEARSIERLMKEFKLSQIAVTEIIHKSKHSVSHLLRLLKLHPEVQSMVADGDIEYGHARLLVSLPDNEQMSTALQVFREGLSVRNLETLLRARDRKKALPKDAVVDSKPAYHVRIESHLSEQLGTNVTLEHSEDNGKGRLIFCFYSLGDLSGLLDKVGFLDGTLHDIEYTGRGKSKTGRIVISYKTTDELNRILARLGYSEW